MACKQNSIASEVGNVTSFIDDAPKCPVDECIQRCIGCRRDVKASMTRIAARKLRSLRALPECSVERCIEFLNTVSDGRMRLHLASMAWWRFSADDDGNAAKPLLRIMRSCTPAPPDFGEEYMRAAVTAISVLTQEQIASWFGCANLYQVAMLFSGDIEDRVGEKCKTCQLYKLGCTNYGSLSSADCPLWRDEFIQGVAVAVRRNGGWRNPCAWIAANGVVKGKSQSRCRRRSAKKDVCK